MEEPTWSAQISGCDKGGGFRYHVAFWASAFWLVAGCPRGPCPCFRLFRVTLLGPVEGLLIFMCTKSAAVNWLGACALVESRVGAVRTKVTLCFLFCRRYYCCISSSSARSDLIGRSLSPPKGWYTLIGRLFYPGKSRSEVLVHVLEHVIAIVVSVILLLLSVRSAGSEFPLT